MSSLVVVFSFATPSKAWANTKLVDAAYSKSSNGDFIFAQIEISEEHKTKEGVDLMVMGGPELPTLRVAEGAVLYAKEKGVTDIRIIAAKPHVWRCIRDIQMSLQEIGLVLPVRAEEIEGITWSQWFHPSSKQARTRSVWLWILRDSILKCLPWTIYKRIAG